MRRPIKMNTEDMIAYCGVNCSDCDDYKSDTCPSCKLTEWIEGDICMPVKCCRKKKIEFCADCDDFPCESMAEFYEESDSHKEAFTRMVVMRNHGL